MELSVKLLFAPLELRATEPVERRKERRKKKKERKEENRLRKRKTWSSVWNRQLESLRLQSEWHASVARSASRGSAYLPNVANSELRLRQTN